MDKMLTWMTQLRNLHTTLVAHNAFVYAVIEYKVQ